MIEFDNISMAYQGASDYALKNISFNINNGEFVFLIGKSGSGKSTIIKLISCEERPQHGKLIIDDVNIHKLPRRMIPFLRRSIGMVFQDFRLIHTKTVYENVAFAMEILGYSKKQIRRRVSIVLSIVGLKDKEKMHPNELSGGEQQRVAIARAIVNNPLLLVADEPTGNLDPVNSESIMAILDEINRNGTTVIICTHDINLVNRMKKRVIEIDNGYIIRDEDKAGYSALANHDSYATSDEVEFVEDEEDSSEVVEDEEAMILENDNSSETMGENLEQLEDVSVDNDNLSEEIEAEHQETDEDRNLEFSLKHTNITMPYIRTKRVDNKVTSDERGND